MWAKTTIGVDDERPARSAFEPLELLGAEVAHAAGLQVGDVDQRDEVHAAMVEAVPAGARDAFAEAVEERLAAVGVEHVVLAGDEEHRQARSPSASGRRRRTRSSRESCETSPVWMMKSGWTGSAFTLAIASRKVARASALGGLLKPMWLSLSWTKVNGLPWCGEAAQRARRRARSSCRRRRRRRTTRRCRPTPCISGNRGGRRPRHRTSKLLSMSISM